MLGLGAEKCAGSSYDPDFLDDQSLRPELQMLNLHQCVRVSVRVCVCSVDSSCQAREEPHCAQA